MSAARSQQCYLVPPLEESIHDRVQMSGHI
jgi:hypothetical protein